MCVEILWPLLLFMLLELINLIQIDRIRILWWWSCWYRSHRGYLLTQLCNVNSQWNLLWCLSAPTILLLSWIPHYRRQYLHCMMPKRIHYHSQIALSSLMSEYQPVLGLKKHLAISIYTQGTLKFNSLRASSPFQCCKPHLCSQEVCWWTKEEVRIACLGMSL